MCAFTSEPNPEHPDTIEGVRLFAVLGTWMEEDVVAASVRNAFTQGCERVYLVDNGSTDRTVEVAVAEGARLARSFTTAHYDEYARLEHMNGVVGEVSAGEPDAHLWWMYMDADEFIHGPHGMTVAAYLRTLDRRFRVVGTRYLNHYPGALPHYRSGEHPLSFQPLAEEIPWMMCPSGHRKHPLLRFDRHGPVLRSGRGFHIPECDTPIVEPDQPAFVHHFPFREEATTRRRLAMMWRRGDDGESRARASDDAAGHMLQRQQSLDAVYSQQWSAVGNFFTDGAGVTLRPWTDIVEPAHHHVAGVAAATLAAPGLSMQDAMHPRVSVIVNFLDAMPFLDEAIASVQAQTFADWELLLVDDGSTDGSTAVARAAAAADPLRVRYLEHAGHANLGRSASRNLGLQQARGEFVAYLDADDWWFPEKLATQVASLDGHPHVDMVYGNSLTWLGWTGKAEDIARDNYRGTGLPAGSVVPPPGMIIHCFPLGPAQAPAMSSWMVRRSVLERVGGSESSFRGVFDDQVVFAKLFLEATVLVTDDRLDKYRVHPDSAVTRAVNTGQLDAEASAYLSWLESYLDRNQRHDPTVRRLLRAAIWPHRHPHLHSMLERMRRLRRRTAREALRLGVLASRWIGRRQAGKFTATPNPATTSDRFGAVVATLRWEAPGVRAVEVRVGGPAGTLLTSGGPSGELITGKWVSDGTAFYLQDVSDGRPLRLRHTIGIITMRVSQAPPVSSTPDRTGPAGR